MKILIKITKEVLRNSMHCSFGNSVSTNCAIAVAIRDLFPNARIGFPTVTFDYSAIENTSFNNILPQKALDFIGLFDSLSPESRLNLPEFSFEIPVPNEIIDRISIATIYKVLSESPTLELVHP